jgi:hypothetical protein
MGAIQKKIIVFIFCFVIAIANGYFFNYLNDKYFHYSSNANGLAEFSEGAKFFIVIVAAPIIETLLFNLLPNLLLNKIRVRDTFLLILIPSIIFSVFHLYHPLYAVMAFIGGIIMNWYFLFSHNKKGISFWLVVLLHSCYNLYGYFFVN